jgi:hypothetical protein
MYSDRATVTQIADITSTQEEKLKEYESKLERERIERDKKLQEERDAAEAKLKDEHEKLVKKMRDDLLNEQEKEKAEIEKKRQLLLIERAEAEKKANEESSTIRTKEKERIMSTFEKENAAAQQALENLRENKKQKLQNRLAAKRTKVDTSQSNPPKIEMGSLNRQNSMRSMKNKFKNTVDSVLKLNRARLDGIGESKSSPLFPSPGKLPDGVSSQSIKLIETKLERIEKVMSLLESQFKSQSVHNTSTEGTRVPIPIQQTSPTLVDGTFYQDYDDPVQGDTLIPVYDIDLQERELAKLLYARRLAVRLGLKDLVINGAKSLPEPIIVQNAFRNSYLYDQDANTLWIHVNRFSTSGDVGLVAIHALSHIKVNAFLYKITIYILNLFFNLGEP